MSDSVRPHRRQPTRLPHPWDSPGKKQKSILGKEKSSKSIISVYTWRSINQKWILNLSVQSKWEKVQRLYQTHCFRGTKPKLMVYFCISIQDLSMGGIDGVSPSLSLKAWVPGMLVPKGTRKWKFQLSWRVDLSFFCFCACFRPSVDWPIHIGESGFLYFINQFKCETCPEIPYNQKLHYYK